jgi:hypothetical protein
LTAASKDGFTPADLARRYRVSEDRVRAWIRKGELHGLNVSDRRGKFRFVVTAEAVADFEARRTVSPPPSRRRKKKKTDEVDYFPDEK